MNNKLIKKKYFGRLKVEYKFKYKIHSELEKNELLPFQ